MNADKARSCIIEGSSFGSIHTCEGVSYMLETAGRQPGGATPAFDRPHSLRKCEERVRSERLCDLRAARVRLLCLLTRKTLVYITLRSSRLRLDWYPSSGAPDRCTQPELL